MDICDGNPELLWRTWQLFLIDLIGMNKKIKAQFRLFLEYTTFSMREEDILHKDTHFMSPIV